MKILKTFNYEVKPLDFMYLFKSIENKKYMYYNIFQY